MKKKRILLLGPNQRNKHLKSFLKKKYLLESFNRKLDEQTFKKFNFHAIITSGYPFLVKKKFFTKVKIAINLHISYLPYGRGLIPNVWSFYENNSSGITIHKLGINFDDGEILIQKKVRFRNIKKHTLKSTHDFLIKKLNKIFKANSDNILDSKIKSYSQNKYVKNYKKYHSRAESNKLLKDHNIKFSDKISKIININR
jgi:methionyl-tRNA formyltransferase